MVRYGQITASTTMVLLRPGRRYSVAYDDASHLHGESTDEIAVSGDVNKKNPSQKVSMEKHTASHLDKRTYPCQYCHKKYNHMSNLWRHKILHTGNVRYPCEICGRRCRNTSTLKAHMKTHIGESPFACEICGKKFKREGNMNNHMKKHHGIRPLPCSICDRTFTQSANHEKHMLLHKSGRTFTYKICENGLIFRETLNTDTETHDETGDPPCTGESEINVGIEELLNCRVNEFDPPSDMESNDLRHQDVSEILERAILGHHSEDSCDEETRMKINSIIEDINKSYNEKYGN
ncbi:hypothetical protein QAD02_019566 [Eretmocerus hayati]|uniref:Uncharacterized protein n=1 Tax=Eretmocerus hayati TaxID=131215 RepID=A0ACC2PKE6_9HYME|nr:hypothetical protein QAD02_019566 [Eretmocerus hayati]